MLINTAPESRAGGAAAWSLLQVSHLGTRLLLPAVKLSKVITVPLLTLKDGWYVFVYLSEPHLVSVGTLQVQCNPAGEDGVNSLAVTRGLLTCCQPHILLSPHMDDEQVSWVQVFKIRSVVLFVNKSLFISEVFTARGFVPSGLWSVSEEDGLSLLSFWGWVTGLYIMTSCMTHTTHTWRLERGSFHK